MEILDILETGGPLAFLAFLVWFFVRQMGTIIQENTAMLARVATLLEQIIKRN